MYVRMYVIKYNYRKEGIGIETKDKTRVYTSRDEYIQERIVPGTDRSRYGQNHGRLFPGKDTSREGFFQGLINSRNEFIKRQINLGTN